ncbi:MAG TPA: hypothetical protein ENI55_02060 [Alphaproteobacteria bacterium]|nr:hypothetical protein [Alphaproteobacteria bacterium]
MDFDFAVYMRFALALVFVLALIGVLVAVARRFGFGYATPAKKGHARRLSIVEVMPVDTKRRLVLVRRDDREHLILLGQTSETLIEDAIPATGDKNPEAGRTTGNGGGSFLPPPRGKGTQ